MYKYSTHNILTYFHVHKYSPWFSLVSHLSDALLQVAASFGVPGLDAVLFSIPVRISEALLSLQENMATFRSKVSLTHTHTHTQGLTPS